MPDPLRARARRWQRGALAEQLLGANPDFTLQEHCQTFDPEEEVFAYYSERLRENGWEVEREPRRTRS